MPEREKANPLALAVMVCLLQKPMHPYEVATTLRERKQHESIKLNYGSLYTVVRFLRRRGFIEPQETEREGGRPERTVFRLTGAGRVELIDWLSALLSTPVKEYTRFEAGLSLMAAIPPAEAVALLKGRCSRLTEELAGMKAAQKHSIQEKGVAAFFLIERGYRIWMLEAELEWTTRLIDDINSGGLEGVLLWQGFHQT